MRQTRKSYSPRSIRLLVSLVLVASVAACGADDSRSGEDTESDGSGEVGQAAENCSGDPIRLTTIAAVNGPAADLEVATDVAVRAVNEDCVLGRPIEVNVCDDRGDPNGSTECGRTAAGDGSVALIGAVGVFDNGAEASGLPAVYTIATGTFDHTNPSSYPFASIVPQLFGSITTAKAAGAETTMFVTFESPATVFIAEQGETLAQELGLEWDVLFFPEDTNDFAPIAAQIVDADPDSLGFGVPQVAPFLQALLAEGWDMQEKPTLSTSILMPPRAIEALGGDGDGLYLMSSVVPPTETGNPAIVEMQEAYEAHGLDFDDASVISVNSWTALQSLVDALSALSPEQISQLDSTTLVEAVTSQGSVESPEVAPFDLSTPAFPDDPVLSTFRLFSRHVMATRLEDGQLVPVSDFIDVETPFELEG